MTPSNSQATNRNLIIAIIVVLCCLCVFLLAIGGGAWYFLRNSPAPRSDVPKPSNETVTPVPTVELSRPAVDSIPRDTENALRDTVVPDSDLYDLFCRLKAVCSVPKTVPTPTMPKVGDTQKFWISNSDTQDNFQVDATLKYITPHSYFWLEDGVDARDSEIKALMDAFEQKIYPTDREFFGSEWTPCVDDDPHIYVLYVRGVGQSTGGYFSTPDEYNPAIFKYSNAHEGFIFNADAESLSDPYTYGTLAHEFQHMIHWNLDANESTWMNEGFSEVASLLNGYGVGGVDFLYSRNPDLPLTEWTSLSNDPTVTGAHYGEAFLFLTYFLDRFGDQVTQAVVKNPENSLTSIDDTLKSLHVTDKQTGQVITADDVVMDWMATMYLQDGSVGDGRYAYHNYSNAPKVSPSASISSCPSPASQGSVNQYGADYIEIDCSGDYTLKFTGSTVTPILPADPHSGKYMVWSNKNDVSDTTLTREFDFTGVQAPLEFSYWTWYDLEQGYDYAYLEASTDGAKHWDIVKTPSCTEKDKSGNSYGCGYNGKSGGGQDAAWINEKVDLSAYAGKKVQLRFEYVTDAEVLGEGLLLDDLSIQAAGYSTDFEADAGGWQGDGFVRIDNVLPQTFRLELIKQGAQTTVQNIPVGADQTAEVPLSLGSGEKAVLIVTGTQRFSHLPAAYSVEIK